MLRTYPTILSSSHAQISVNLQLVKLATYSLKGVQISHWHQRIPIGPNSPRVT